MTFQVRIFMLLLVLITGACRTPYQAVRVSGGQLKMNSDSIRKVDSVVYKTILPYKLKLDSSMKQTVGINLELLVKEKPEGTLCNLAADAVMQYATEIAGRKVDFVVLNYGGLRISSIGKGPITNGKIFELMPFENEVVLLELSGTTVLKLFKLIGENEGWPVSGAGCVLNGKEATEIMIGGKPVAANSTYILATSDYLANGGDNAAFLSEAITRKELHYKIRDAITDFVKRNTPINMKKEGRIKSQ